MPRTHDPIAEAMKATGLSRAEIIRRIAHAVRHRHPKIGAQYASTLAQMDAAAKTCDLDKARE